MDGVFLDFFCISVDDGRHRLGFLNRQSKVLHPKVWVSLESCRGNRCTAGKHNVTAILEVPESWDPSNFLQPILYLSQTQHNTAMAKRTKEEKAKKGKSAVPLVKSKGEIDPALASLFAQSVSSNSYTSCSKPANRFI